MIYLDEIRPQFENGGNIKTILNKVNSSKANFVDRLKDPNRKFIKDWASNGIATHKLSVGTDEHGNHYIYPEVQEINGNLVDFTRPPYTSWAGMVSAEERGDTVRVPSIEEGVIFTENYKKYYPKGHTFEDGRTINRPKFEKGGTINRPQDRKELDWMKYWLTNRKKQLKNNADATSYGYTKYYPRKDTTDVREAGWTSEHYGNFPNPIAYLKKSTPTKNRINKLIYAQLENADNTPKTEVGSGTSDNYELKGVYVQPDSWFNKNSNYIAFAGKPNSSVKIHEFTHASHPTQQIHYINDVIYNNNVPNVAAKNNKSIDNADELYAALQEFRYNQKIKPNQVITQKWIDNNRDAFKYNYLNNVPDSIKLRLFNEVAQNNIYTNNNYL